MSLISLSAESLDRLRESVRSRMSDKRFVHTAAVETMVTRLASLYCPEKADVLRAAALLHDITKEYDTAQQMEICERLKLPTTETDRAAPKTLHARTAAALIPEEFPAYADETVISAVRWHTTGRADMSLCEKLLYLADYIDGSRLFPDCVRLRTLFWREKPETMSDEKRLSHLDRTLILSFDMTIRALVSEGAIVSADTVNARNALLLAEMQRQKNH